MEAKDYLGYIAYFWKNVIQLTPRTEFLEFLKTNLGVNMFNAPLPKIRDTTRYLYKSYVASIYTRYNAMHIASKLVSASIEKFVEDTVVLNTKYGVFYETVDRSFTPATMDKHIKNAALQNYKSILSDLLTEETSTPKTIKSKPAKSSPKKAGKTKRVGAGKTGVAKKATGKKAAAKKATGKKTSPKASAKKKVAKKSPKAAAKKKVSPKIKVKRCGDYFLKDLRSMAKDLGIRGYSTMDHSTLCSTLRIKK